MVFSGKTAKVTCVLLFVSLLLPIFLYAEPSAYSDDQIRRYEQKYEEAFHKLYTRKFSEARALFKELIPYKDSRRMAKFALDYLKSEPLFQDRMVNPQYLDRTYEYGELYHPPQGGRFYVPFTLNDDTSFVLYHCGGGAGEDYLYYSGVYRYFEDYHPNAVIYFCNESAYDYMYRKNEMMYGVLQHIAYDCGTIVHDISTMGSSLGCYTAMKAAAQFYTDHGQIVNNVCTLDTGLYFNDDYHSLTDEECDAVAEAGTVMYLFEEPGVGMQVRAIARMVNHGIETWVVECAHDNHSVISMLAYQYGVFSWSAGEDIELPASEYTFKLLSPRTESP